MWSEQTVIQPVAWGSRVERDLWCHVANQCDIPFDQETQLPAAKPDGFDAACAEVRELLATAVGPQTVTLHGDGTATVVPFGDVPSVDEHAAREAEIEALRSSRTDEAQATAVRAEEELRAAEAAALEAEGA